MKITEFLKKNILFLDGGTGTLLQSAGLAPGELPERWNLTHPDVICDIHKSYFDAGSNIVCTNTFGANSLKYSNVELKEIITAAVANARRAAGESLGSQPKWVALDIGPTGRMLKPLGDLDFEDAVAVFAETVRLGVRCGVDLIFIETMSDSYETKAALLAAKENSCLPVFVLNAYGSDGKLTTGADPLSMIALLEGMGADAIGVNCSLGPEALMPVIDQYLKYSSLPIIMKPNAGLPRLEKEKTFYDLSADAFARDLTDAAKRGVSILGGCCGTTPEYIASIVERTKGIKPLPVTEKEYTLVSSYTHAVVFGESPVLIGERINPTGKPRFKEALRSGEIDYLLREGIAEEEAGAHILDVNVGLPEINEADMLSKTVTALQTVTDLPLQIDTSDSAAMERALRLYNGKAMINSVNGKAESMAAVFPLAKKYGGLVVALTLDENGIPKTAEGRVEIAKRILAEAEKYGISRKNLIFDPLAMAVSADKNAAKETLRAVKQITEELRAHTSLGVSNVSFGLPERDIINSSYFTMALSGGLSAAILNPHSPEMMKAYRAYLALAGLDDNFENYIDLASSLTQSAPKKSDVCEEIDLKKAITKGMKDQAASLTRSLLKEKEPLEIINGDIVPALDEVGDGYEKKTVYLPGLLMSAEAAGAAFEVIKASMPEGASADKCRIVLATVKGDIHDIGKNIVKLILENYGHKVFDLGKDVPPEEIVREAKRLGADIVGLSALMTTTVPAMKEAIRLLRRSFPECKIIVGGAVLTEEYARTIGADFYGKDAMEAVKYAESVLKIGQR
nr:homocysteine methyltransferase [Oscillospiraceae bacterium]